MIKSIIYLLLLFFFSVGANATKLNAEVDRTELGSNESLRLIVTVNETAQNNIDFSELELQFDIISIQPNKNHYNINGKSSLTTQWILILSPKESGTLIIPSFEYKNSYSQAITITVNDAQTYANNQANRDVFLRVNINKNTSYVQEQLLVTMRLYYKTSLSSYDDETLTIENTTVKLVSETNFRSDVKGVNYNVLEKIYALHPQASGKLTIPSQSWRLEKALNRFNFGRSGNPYLYVRSDPITVNVKPIASNSTADTWLPSNTVTLDGQWKQSIIQAKVGEPLNLQLILIGNGLTAAQLPNISLPTSDKFTVYEDQPNVDDKESSVGIIGTRINEFAVIPRDVGSFTFPAITVKWWNTLTNKEEQARIPAQTIVVVRPEEKGIAQLPKLNAVENHAQQEEGTNSSLVWKVLTALFALLSLALTYLLYRIHYRKSFAATDKAAIHNLNGLKRQGIVHSSLKQIEQAAAQQDWKALKLAVIAWGNQLRPKHPLHSLHDIGEAFPDLKADLEQLDKQLYGAQHSETYQPEKLISAIKEVKREKLTGSSPHALKPLYK